MSQNSRADIHNSTGFLASAHAMADAAALETIRFFRQNPAIDDKSKDPGNTGPQRDFDPVTAADKAAETAIRRIVTENFPNHGMHGEELGRLNPDARHCWVVDPIDGTAAYILGWPMWGTLIGLTEDGNPVLGMMDQPFTRERFWTTDTQTLARGHEGTERVLKTRSCEDISNAILTTTHPDFFATTEQKSAFLRVSGAAKTTRYGGDCYAYAMLASGFCDLIVESGLNAYDIAALIPIVEKAGGIITTWSGDPATYGGDVVASGDPRVHAAALDIINSK